MRTGFFLLSVFLIAFLPGSPTIPGASGAAPPADLKFLHVLLIFDTDDPSLDEGLKVDRERVEKTLRSTIPRSRLGGGDLVILAGREVTPKRILEEIRKLPVRPEDSLLVFFGGHGGQTRERKLFLLTRGGELPRSELLQAMDAKKAGLTVLLTDCCSNLIRRNGSRDIVDRPGVKVELRPVMRSLFFASRGKVDITAASDDKAYGDDASGGLFTKALCELWKQDAETATSRKLVARLHKGEEQTVSWEEFFAGLKEDTEASFTKWRDKLPRSAVDQVSSKSQTPKQYSLAELVKTETSTPAGTKTYAVVNLINRAGRAIKYEYRWEGEKEWMSATLGPGERKQHVLALASPERPAPPLEAQIEGIKSKSRMPAGRWTGIGKPGPSDGRLYEVKPRRTEVRTSAPGT
jgi:hypothetical protein